MPFLSLREGGLFYMKDPSGPASRRNDVSCTHAQMEAWLVGTVSFAQLGIAGYLSDQVQFATAEYGASLALSFARYGARAVLIAGCFHYLRVQFA